MEIEGVEVYPVKLITDERGMVCKIPTPLFTIRDVYVTTVRKDAIKAWHGYKTKSLYWTVVSGLVKLALYDNRPDSASYGLSETLFLGTTAPQSVLVPPGVFSGFKAIENGESIIVVQADEVFSEEGMIRLPYNHFEYSWGIRHG